MTDQSRQQTTSYALVVIGREIRATDGAVMAADGERFWVLDEPEGWVEATSTQVRDNDEVPADLKTWTTRASAEKFGRRWKGHPWWCSPKGFEVVEVLPRMITRREGWRRAG